MATHSTVAQRILDVFLSLPADSAGRGIAEEIQRLEPLDGMDLLLTMLEQDPPETTEHQVARVLLPVIIAEVIPVAAPVVSQ